MKLLLAEMTRLEARDAFDQGATVVIPTGSTEQHGPHLPLIVDTCTAEHIARSAAARAASDVPIVVAPTVTYGSSHHHLPWAGSMSLSVRTYMAVIEDLIRCVAHHGGKRVALVNGHGGNVAPHDVVTSALTLELDIAVAAVSYWTLAEKELAAEGLDGLGGIPGPTRRRLRDLLDAGAAAGHHQPQSTRRSACRQRHRKTIGSTRGSAGWCGSWAPSSRPAA